MKTKQQGMSEGARIMIERMKELPEEFTKNGKYGPIVNMLEGNLYAGSIFAVSARDLAALKRAYEGVKEANFTKLVLESVIGGVDNGLCQDLEKNEAVWNISQGRGVGKSMTGRGSLGAQQDMLKADYDRMVAERTAKAMVEMVKK